MVSLRDDQLKTAEVPLYIHERKAGCLHISREGLYTVLEAELPGSAAELVRLWAHGEGRDAYLGVMQPKDGGLWFSRRLSRRELAAFPEPIAFVSNQENKLTENDLHNNIPEDSETKKEAEPGDTGDEAEAGAAADESIQAPAQTDYRTCPWPAEPPEEGLLWYSRPDGSLVSFDGISTLLALPAELRAPVPGAAERVIEGKKYLVFRT